MGAAASSVHQLQTSVHREQPIEAIAVVGMSYGHFISLGRDPTAEIETATTTEMGLAIARRMFQWIIGGIPNISFVPNTHSNHRYVL